MDALERISFSIEKPLLARLHRLQVQSRYENRSEFIRDLIRDRLVEDEWERDGQVVGTITVLFSHHQVGLQAELTEAQHDHHDLILANCHVHLDHDHCLEVIMVKGQASKLHDLTAIIKSRKGVLHAVLAMTATGDKLGAGDTPHAHPHPHHQHPLRPPLAPPSK